MFFQEEPEQYRFPVFEADCSATEIQELLSFFQNDDEPVSSNSGGSIPNRAVHSIDERKRRRMMSNRESARRSRWRKKRHLEILTSQANRLKVENRTYKNRLGLIRHQYQVVERENERLRSEAIALWTRLSDLYQNMQSLSDLYGQIMQSLNANY